MPIPSPESSENQNAYMSRCISSLMKEGKYPQKQCVAICFSKWRDKDDGPIDKALRNREMPKLQKLLDYSQKTDDVDSQEGVKILRDAMQEVDEFIEKFDESLHPRADDGKFTNSSGSSRGRQQMIGPAISLATKAIPVIAKAGPILARSKALGTVLSKVWPVLDKVTSGYFAYSMVDDILGKIKESQSNPEPKKEKRTKYDWKKLGGK